MAIENSGVTPAAAHDPHRAANDARAPLAGVEALTFDVGSTLLFNPFRDVRKARRSAVKKWLRGHGTKADRYALRAAISRAELVCSDGVEKGDRDAASRAADQLVAAAEVRPTSAESRELRRLIGELGGALPYRPAPHAATVLRWLADRGLKLGIVSNRGSRAGWITMRYLDRFGIGSLFAPAAIAWSDELGCSKPDADIFAFALRGLDTVPGRVAHVGNSKRSDVLGARRAGVRAVRYAGVRDDSGEGPEADAVIRGFDELPGVLGLPAMPAAA